MRKLRPEEMPQQHRHVLMMMASHKKRHQDKIYPALATLAYETALSVSTIKRVLKDLEMAVWITRQLEEQHDAQELEDVEGGEDPDERDESKREASPAPPCAPAREAPSPAPIAVRRPGRPCACCISPRREELDRGIASGMSYLGASKRFGVGDDSVRHHAIHCIPDALRAAADARASSEALTVESVLEEVSRLLTDARDGLASATADTEASHRDRAGWLKEVRATCELLARLRGELVTVNANYLTVFLNSSDWRRMSQAIIRAIRPEGASYEDLVTRGEISADIVTALRALDA
jgi:hypothetical protein